MNLSARVKSQWDSQPSWMEDLEEITKKVDNIFGNSVDLNEDRAERTAYGGGSGIKIRSKEDWSRHLRSSGSEILNVTKPT